MDFHKKNRLKLSLTYLAIIMFLSVSFSIAFYKVTTQEIRRGLRPAPPELIVLESGRPPQTEELRNSDFDDFEKFRGDRISQSDETLRIRLLIMNLIALFVGAGISYLLARQALSPIERAMEKQDRFASDASHELRTPLAAMHSEIEVALRDKKLTSKESREILESNLDEVKKMTSITSSLLSLAHSEKQSQEFVKSDLNLILKDVIDEFTNKNPEIKILNEVNMSDNNIVCEPEQIKRLISIVFDNAIKYSDGDVAITTVISVHHKHIQLDIKDNGLGIKEEERLAIFDRFYRSDVSRTKNENSSYGLGLSIAKNIVELHRGNIMALPNDPKGTIIRIILPKA
jgi:two-component system sensor histidine kinase CiaH